ncbi:MAG: DUF4012 domain-containing protein [Candidatus Liptonbacteria bacterium]|nr:DUF4012 domain-containing protein [Candidatus Liptonbacteria bacterium]
MTDGYEKRVPDTVVDVVRVEGGEGHEIRVDKIARFAAQGGEAPRAERAGAGSKRPAHAFLVFFILVAAVAGAVFFSAYREGGRLLDSAAKGISQFQSAVEKLDELDPAGAHKDFLEANQNIEEYFASRNNPAPGPAGLLDILPVFKNLSSALGHLKTITGSSLSLLEQLVNLRIRWLPYMLHGNGAQFIEDLKEARRTLANIAETGDGLAAASLKLKSAVPVDTSAFLPLQLNVNRSRDFLDALIGFLSAPGERHIAVLFHNTSEMRPGGGFVGSYADLTLSGGNLTLASIHDINEPDRAFAPAIIPPKQFFGIEKWWRLADANWFFDFSLSARKLAEFFELSRLYASRGVTFDGVIAISPRVVSDVLESTGPIELSSSKRTLTSENFLREIQSHIEESRSRKDQNPKAFLQEFADAVRSKLASRSLEDIGLTPFERWLEERDVMVYFKDPALNGFFDFHGWTGTVAALAPNFNGDYFAAVNANIGGGKTDLVMEQKIVFQSQIESDGTVSDHVQITRSHRGSSSDPSWYRAANQNYIKIYTPPSVTLTHAEGGIRKELRPLVDYEARGYLTDPDVARIESTAREYLNYPTILGSEEYGKHAFGVWSRVPRGESDTITLDYEHRLFAPVEDGAPYEFIFQKQSGSSASYHFAINAPIGYVWKENKLPVFEYSSSDPAGTVRIPLTFSRLE